jgi:hypothetical protein
MIYTLGDARTFLAPFIDEGICPDDTRVITRVNEATSRLLTQGDWVNSVVNIKYFTYGDYIALPYDVEKIIGATVDCSPVGIFSPIYEFVENGPGNYRNLVYSNLVDMGDGFPTFFDPPQGTCTVPAETVLMAFSKSAEDATLTVHGYDYRKNKISEDIVVNHWVGGVEGAITNISAVNKGTLHFLDIDHIVKSVTENYVSLYAWDPVTYNMYALSKFHMDETAPSYRRYRISAANRPSSVPVTTDNDHCGQMVYVRAKKRYLPALRNTDVLLIQNLSALKLMVQALVKENNYEVQVSAALEAKAIAVLDKQLSNNRTADNLFQVESTAMLSNNIEML